MARDVIHNAVKNALIKDGWTITHDPYTIRYGDEKLYADLAAERPIAAEKAGNKIIVEIKSFIGYSVMQDFEEALGQYLLYQVLLAETAPEYKLYIGISKIAFTYDLQRQIVKFVLEKNQVPLLVVDIESEEITQWIR